MRPVPASTNDGSHCAAGAAPYARRIIASTSSETRAGTRLAVGVAVLAIVALSLLCIGHERTFFWHCDYTLWYSPYFEEIVRAWHEGDWPMLSADTWAAGHIAGEFQCGTFSVFQNVALVLLWALPLSLPGKAAAFSILHLCVLATGVVLLARQRGLSSPLSAGVALVAAFNGWTITWAASQWVAFLTGYTWLPWAWWALESALHAPQGRARWLWPAVFLYLLLSAGNPFSVLMLGIVTLWLAARSLAETRKLAALAPLAVAWAFGLALSAPGWLMLLEFNQYTVRGHWGWMLQPGWVVPWRAWPALWLPSLVTLWGDFFGFAKPHFSIELAGGLVPASAVVALLVRRRREAWGRCRWELLLLATVIVLASVPLIGSFRWSYRFLPLFHLILALLGAEALTILGSSTVALFALVLTGAAALLPNQSPALAVWESAILGLWLLSTRRLPSQWLTTGVTATLLLTVYFHLSITQAAYVLPFGENMLRPGPLATTRLYLGLYAQTDLDRGMKEQPGWGAVLRPGNTALYADLHFLNGYSSFTALGVPAFFEQFGSTSHPLAETLMSPGSLSLLDLLGVDGLVFGPDEWDLARDLGPEWKPVFASGEAKVFHREPARSTRVKALASYDPEPELSLAQPQVRLMHESRQRVSVEISPAPPGESAEGAEDIGIVTARRGGPAVIAFMRPYFPGYRATFNGHAIPVENYVGVIPSVRLPAGAHGALELTYSPDSLRVGASVALAGLGIWVALLVMWRSGAQVRERRAGCQKDIRGPSAPLAS